MSLLTATTVSDWMFRGSDYLLTVEVCENNEPFQIPAEATAKLFLAYSESDRPVVELDAHSWVRDEGLVAFKFNPEDTANLIAGAYDLYVTLYFFEQVWHVLKKRFAVIGFNQVGDFS